MKILSYSVARKSLGSAIQQACDDHAPVIITRERGPAVVMLSLEDYASLIESSCLLASQANRSRLQSAIQQLGDAPSPIYAFYKDVTEASPPEYGENSGKRAAD